MPLQSKVRNAVAGALGTLAEQRKIQGPRLLDDALRLWTRVQKFLALDLVQDADLPALELACYGLQLPLKQCDPPPPGKFGRTNLRDRAERSAELLVELLGESVEDDDLLDRAVRLLQEMHHRPPMIEDARLLSDVCNLDDFGVIGLSLQIIQLARQGSGLAQLVESCIKRDEYGYWEARLKDGFHFDAVREIARQRIEHARQTARFLAAELAEDRP